MKRHIFSVRHTLFLDDVSGIRVGYYFKGSHKWDDPERQREKKLNLFFRERGVILAIKVNELEFYRTKKERKKYGWLIRNSEPLSRRGIIFKCRLFCRGRLGLFPLQVHPGRLLVGCRDDDHCRLWRHDVRMYLLAFPCDDLINQARKIAYFSFLSYVY